VPNGIVQTAAVFLRVLIATAQFLAEVPVAEQGYPSYAVSDCILAREGWLMRDP